MIADTSGSNLQSGSIPRSSPGDRRWIITMVLLGLCWTAYLPALNNGFISDDYIVLDWLDQWKSDFSYLFRIVPDVFRITSYAVFALVKFIFGLHPGFFYAFTISVHVVNAILLWSVLARATGNHQPAVVAATLFAVLQNPQEAVMWLAAMGDALAGLCILAAALFWLRNRFHWAALFYVLGLFSKESALALPLLLGLLEVSAGQKLRWRVRYLYLVIPAVLFSLYYMFTLGSNYLVTNGSYGTSATHALLVLGMSLHRLMFPWLYVAALLFVLRHRRGGLPSIGAGLAWAVVALLPYLFLTYQNHVPSRHEYIASMGLVWAVAALWTEIDSAGLRHAFLAAFVVVNIGYLWLKKDTQFEERAAPTSQLLLELRRHPPGPLVITGFPLNPWIARNAAGILAGWNRDLITVDQLRGRTGDRSLELRWDPISRKYSSDVIPTHSP